jgi:DNA-binding transcriptional LysR family regulator
VFSHIEAVARAGSIRKAAEALFITPSALDRRVQDLEAELDVELFERHARGVRLTAAGEVFLHHVRAQRADFERIQAEIQNLKGLRRGSVTIAASQALAYSVLPEVINAFRAANPGISFKVRICDRQAVVAALRAFEADLGVVYNVQPVSDLTPLMQVEQRLCAVMAAKHPLAAQASVKMRDCLKYPLALPDPDALAGTDALARGVSEALKEPEGVKLALAQPEGLPLCVALGLPDPDPVRLLLPVALALMLI